MGRPFTCVFTSRTSDYRAIPAEVRFVPDSWAWADMGGCDQATIEVQCPPEMVSEAERLLGDYVTIHNEHGTSVWWGHVHEVEMRRGSLTIRTSLEEVYNRIAVTYTYTAIDGAPVQGKTDWAEDSESIAQYGRKELLLSFEGEESEAEIFRDIELARRKLPTPTIHRERAIPGATLHCLGPFHRLGWQYYEDLSGLEEYNDEGPGEQYLGARYTATTISFAAQDDILDSANNFGALTEGTRFFVSGASNSANNTTGPYADGFVVKTEGAGAIETVDQNRVTESAGAEITLTLGGTRCDRIAQSFTLSNNTADWTVAAIAIRAQRVGSPADNITVSLYTNSSGNPGTLIEEVAIAGSTISDEAAWLQFTFTNTATLTYGTTYWIVVKRDTPSINAYYIVDVNEDATYSGGQVKVSADNGGTWSVRDPAADMPFRITGKRETTAQLVDILAANDTFGTVTVLDDSGVETAHYREGDTLALDEAMKLLEIGTASLERLLLRVLEDRSALVRKQQGTSTIDVILDAEGRLRTAFGGLIEPGIGIAGEWIGVNQLLLDEDFRSRSFFIASAEYNAGTDFLNFETDGNRKPAYLTKTRQG